MKILTSEQKYLEEHKSVINLEGVYAYVDLMWLFASLVAHFVWIQI